MSEFLYRIRGGISLHGEVGISGAKNAAMPILAAATLSREPSLIRNIPAIDDVTVFTEILQCLGVHLDVAEDRHSVVVRADHDLVDSPPDHLVANQRASFLVMGPLLARQGRAVDHTLPAAAGLREAGFCPYSERGPDRENRRARPCPAA